jgi:F0F1-type ATP synthase membrane subunit a
VEESPLHAFELHDLIPLVPAGVDISINKAVILMWVIVGLVAFLMISAAAARKLVPGKLQNMAEFIVEFIRGIILDTMGEAGMKYFPLIATLFLFILFANLARVDSRFLYRDESDYCDGGLCRRDLRIEPGARIFAPWHEVPRYSRAARHTGVAPAVDDSD